MTKRVNMFIFKRAGNKKKWRNRDATDGHNHDILIMARSLS